MYGANHQHHTYRNATLFSKTESLKARIKLLAGLEKVVAGKTTSVISADQWFAINNQLATVVHKLLHQLSEVSNTYFAYPTGKANYDTIVNKLGEIEIDLSQAYTFYDTYMDILTQRLSPELGPLLKGCDAIAEDGLKHHYLMNITHKPIVYCDRGFGASILREGVSISKTVNPVAFIAIPYSRLAEKYNLISIYHEVGHQAMSKLNLVDTFQEVFATVVKNAGGNQLLQNMFANWSKEIVPDFWAFAHTGMGQTSSMKDILLVPKNMAFQTSPYQQHPPSYLRFLISVEWCRYLWGRGEWDHWEEEWKSFYPIKKEDELTQNMMRSAKKFLREVAVSVITTRFKNLNRKPLTSLFNMQCITPANLNYFSENTSHENFQKQTIGVQLSAFRLLKDKNENPIQEINAQMKTWLIKLAHKKSNN